MDMNSASLNGDDKNHHDNNSQSLNCNEITIDNTKSPRLIHSMNMTDDKNEENNCEKNNTHDHKNVELNMADIEFNRTNKTKFDDSSIATGPMKKKYKKASDNSTDTEEIYDNMKPSCSTSKVSKYSSRIKYRRYRKQSVDNDYDDAAAAVAAAAAAVAVAAAADDDDEHGGGGGDNNNDDDDNDTKDDEIAEKSEDTETNTVDQSNSSPVLEPEVVTNSSIDNDESAQSDRDERNEQQLDSSEKSDHSSDWTTASEDELDTGVPAVLKKRKPKPKWFIVPEVMNRQIGNNKYLDRNFYGSLHVVQRMKLLHQMCAHEGCVNGLCFNESGKYLASASDDLKVIVWDWARKKDKNIFTSGHRLNIFDVKWLPIDYESMIVTCSRDGHVRVIDTRTSTNRRLTSHRKEARGLAVHPDHVYGILSVGDDGKVLSIDIRAEKPTRLLTVKDRNSYIPLYTIHINPRNSNEFCVGGRSRSVKIYDRRRILEPVHNLCPHNLRQSSSAYVTSTVYNYNGTELLASYSDDDIYLFDTALPHPNGDYAHHYEGHRNSVTIKGVNFFGPKSEFIVSGSDCANIFVWEKNSEAIVQWMLGDNHGVVNRLESHPHMPILATSGLDSDVKIWVPSNKTEPTMSNLESCIKTNMSNRAADGLHPDVFDSRMLSVFFHHVRQYGLYRGQSSGSTDRILHNHLFDEISESSNDSASSNNNNGDDSSLDDDTEIPQCAPS